MTDAAPTYTHCQRPGCGKPKTPPKARQKDVPLSSYEEDPYCSTECCKLDHGQVDRQFGKRMAGGKL